MALFLLVLFAGVAGYFLAKSRWSRPIDDAAERAAQTSRRMADQVEDGMRGIVGRRRSPTTVIDGEAVDAPAAEKKPSRRQSETDTGVRKE